MRKIISLFLALLVMPMLLFSQNDTLPQPDRMAEDFVTVSLCVADPTDWHQDVLGVSGHAFLRMQCPYYGLDYCFSYEGENVNDNLYRYLSGKTKMGYFGFKTDDYLEDYKKWNRSVHEYILDLPPEAETRLWEILDNNMISGRSLRQDLTRYGCAITVVKFIKKALGRDYVINYTEDEYLVTHTRREIAYRSLEQYPWLRLVILLFTDSRYDKDCPLDEKLIIPVDLAAVWQQATVDGRAMATYRGELVSGAEQDGSKKMFTPMLCAIIILLLTIAFSFTRWSNYWDYLLLSIEVLLGLALIVCWIIIGDLDISAYILLVLFNPLPLIFWKWRRHWAVYYAGIVILGVAVLACLPHMIVDPAILVLALSYVVMYGKDSVRDMFSKLKVRKR